MTELTTSGVAAPVRPAAVPKVVRRVARQLESSFAAELLRAARPPAREGMFSGGTGARSFDSFMDDALGDAMMSRGGLGLTRQIEQSILGTQRSRALGQATGQAGGQAPVVQVGP